MVLGDRTVGLVAFSKLLESLKDFLGFTDRSYLVLILCSLERIILFGARSCVVSDGWYYHHKNA